MHTYAELHARSAFSFLRGASSPEQMMERAAELGISHVAMTDRQGLYGSARAHHKAMELGIQAIAGAELVMESGGVLPVLVRTRQGYQNLCKLLTRAHLAAPKGQSVVTWAALEEHAAGLTALTGDEEGLLHTLLATRPRMEVLAEMEKLRRIFEPGELLVEVQRHHLRTDPERVRLAACLAHDLGLPVLASNAPCHAGAEGRMLLDAFTCLRHHTHLDAAGRLLSPNAERRLKTAAEMRALFADMPDALETSGRLVERVEFTLQNLGYEFPQYSVPDGHDQDSFLRERTYEGARRLYPALTSTARAQLEKELALISKLRFSGYFLVVWDLVAWCAQQGILAQGRGSAANSAVCYCLGITKVDPIASKLLFERFLTESRGTWPDIDIDLPSGERRERVIQEMYRRFAPHGAAMTANVITYRGRSIIREMGKVLNLPQDVIERFTDLYANGDFPHTLGLENQLRQAGLPQGHPRLRALTLLYHQAYGLPRHLGQHSGGMVLCTRGLDTIVPLEPATMPGRVVVQWDKDDCEDLGIIKVDLLGLGMMAVLQETLATSAARGRPVDLARLPKDDAACYDLMQRADTIGVFQIESRAQMATLPRLKPREFYDLVVEVAIIRPGPIVGKLVHPYLKRREGREEIEYIHPCFEDLLKRTLGVPLFQEQILAMAMRIAGFTGSEAEELRRAMSFHRSEERMNKALAKLRRAMTEHAVDAHVQERVVDSIRSFALYGFPESHAISFALIAYASVWMKVHRTVEFYTALLNCQPMGFYSTATLVRDARHHGLRVQPVCVARSEELCTVVDDATLRLGLNQLRGISGKTVRILLEERARAPWVDVNDFLARCPMPRKERRVLARAGALNTLGGHRRDALWAVEKELHDDLLSPLEPNAGSPLPPMTPAERLQADYQTTALTVGPHPMKLLRPSLKRVVRAADLPTLKHGARVTVIGMVICRQRPGTAKGHCFISLEDETGIANAFVPSALFEARRLVITQEGFLKISGRLQRADNVVTVLAQSIQPFRQEVLLERVSSHDFH